MGYRFPVRFFRSATARYLNAFGGVESCRGTRRPLLERRGVTSRRFREATEAIMAARESPQMIEVEWEWAESHTSCRGAHEEELMRSYRGPGGGECSAADLLLIGVLGSLS
jgi:hypothetical protein